MPDELFHARNLASTARFLPETRTLSTVPIHRESRHLSNGRQMGLEISSDLVPGIFKIIRRVCNVLDMQPGLVRSFIHPSADMQARCSISDHSCIVEMSSGLVEKLGDDELAFVIGHELGHFLLDHHYVPLPPSNSIDHFRMSRLREISADRIGLISCGRVDVAMSAILKTFSGLSEKYLRFDVNSFIRRALSEDMRRHVEAAANDTHPSFAVRAHCLLKFSTIIEHWRKPSWESKFEALDARIEADFENYSEKGVIRQASSLKEQCKEWIWLAAIADDGQITPDEITHLTREFGETFIEKIRMNFHGACSDQVRDIIKQNSLSSLSKLSEALPMTAESEINGLIENSSKALGINAGVHPIWAIWRRH